MIKKVKFQNNNRWSGRYCGPGSFCLAVPLAEQVVIITDHSAIFFLKDGTPCESVLLDKPITDAGKLVYIRKYLTRLFSNHVTDN